MDVLGQQRAPAKRRLGMLDRIGEDVRHARAEILRQRFVEGGEILLRTGGDEVISALPARRSNLDAEAFAFCRSIDRERGRQGLGSRVSH